MAMMVDPPNGIGIQGKHYYTMWQIVFEIDTKYVPIKPIGRGAYGIVCSSINRETNERVAIKKINNVFDNRVDALRTLRELKLLRHLRHENVIALKDIMMPVHRRSFKDVYLVSELMDTDLHQIIKSSQPLSNDHCQYFLFQVSCVSVNHLSCSSLPDTSYCLRIIQYNFNRLTFLESSCKRLAA
jgi:mitogen-activated protein kinase 1/2